MYTPPVLETEYLDRMRVLSAELNTVVHSIAGRIEVLHSLRDAVKEAIHEAARLNPEMAEVTVVFEECADTGSSFHLTVALDLTTGLIQLNDAAIRALGQIFTSHAPEVPPNADAQLLHRIMRGAELTLINAAQHIRMARRIVGSADSEIEQLRNALVQLAVR